MATDEPRRARVALNVITVLILIVAVIVGVKIATEHSTLAVPPTSSQNLVLSPDGTTAYVAGQGHVGVERLTAGGVSTSENVALAGGQVTHLAITPNGRELLATTANGKGSGELFAIDLAQAPPSATHLFSGNVFESLAISADGSFALVGQSGKFVTNATTGTTVENTPGSVDRLKLQTSLPTLTDSITVGYGIAGIVIAPTGSNAFVLNEGMARGPQQLTTLQLTTTPIDLKGSVAVAGAGLLLSPNGYTAYVGASVVNVLGDPTQLLAPAPPPPGLTSLSGFTAQAITPNGRFVYLSGGGLNGQGGISQVVEDTSTTPPSTSTFQLTNCTNVTINPQGTRVYCGASVVFPVVPTVNSLSSIRGGSAGGYLLTLNGTSLSQEATVNIGPDPAVVNSVNRAGTSLTVTVPSGTLGPAQVSVTTSGGSNPPTPAAVFTYNSAPAVKSLNPTRGLIQGGTELLIGGSGFTAKSIVDFGPNNPGHVINVSPDGSYLAVQAPAGSGTVEVTVTSAVGTSGLSNGARFRFEKEQPVVLAIRPTKGAPNGGYGILIGGRYMNGVTQVLFGVTPAKLMQVAADGDYLGVIVPPGVGTVDVTVTTPSGTSSNVSTDHFTYTGS
jgi:hypothetical protein